MKDSETSTATTATLAFYGGATLDSMTVSAFVTSGPAGSIATPQLTLAETSNAFVKATAPIGTAGVVGDNFGQVAFVGPSAATVYSTAKFNIIMAASNGTTAAVKAGTYVITLVPAVTGGGGIKNASNVTLTITVTADPLTDTVVKTADSIITTAADTTNTTDATVTASRTLAATTPGAAANAVAFIKVAKKNAAGVTTTGESYTAVVKSGPGLLGSGALTNTYAATAGGGTADARGRAITVRGDNEVAVFADGSSGVSVIEISSAAGVILATETLTFFGTATTATASVAVGVIGTSAATGKDAVLVKFADSAGVSVSNITTLYVTSSATATISGTYTSQAVTYDTIDKGYYVDLTGVAAGTASVTVGTKSSAAATTGIDANAVSIRVGGNATKLDDVLVTFDKASYLPGELAVITVKPVDAAGLILAPDTYTVFATGGIVAPVALGANSATITGTTTDASGVGTVDGVVTHKIYMPSYAGTFVFKYKTGTMATTAKSAVARTISVDVSTPDSGAAAAAAEEATAAANYATDAALSAAEAAEAATAMAQEAVDAVAELSASVTKLISALRAQITTLTNLVVKIQKKVKA